MHVTWDPENGEDKQSWAFDPDDVLGEDAKKIERYYGGTYDQWVAGLQSGQIQARTVLLWYMLAQVHPKLKFEDVPKFRVRQLKVEMGVRELKSLFARVQRMRLSDEDQQNFEMVFQADMADAMAREFPGGSASVVDGQLSIEGADTDLPKPA